MGIGKDGRLPWYLPEDLKYFSKVTTTTEAPGLMNAVIMGRKAWEAIPEENRPLANRINCVISSNDELDLPFGVLQFGSLEEALTALSTSEKIDQIFVAGGAQLYQEAILNPELERIYLTRIEADYECDVFFPDEIPDDFEIISATETLESDGLEYSFVVLDRHVDHSDEEYIDFEVTDED